MNTFNVGDRRVLIVGKRLLTLKDEATHQFANLSFVRWRRLRDEATNIDNMLERIAKKETGINYRVHLGGGWFVSITPGFWCVDIRKFYLPNNDTSNEIRPSRIGIGLRIREWRVLRDVMDSVDAIHPDIATTELCFHQNQEGILFKLFNNNLSLKL